ncbi:MAG: DEAD/DEAH box helicase [Chitinivibrionales bacterium]|nr:DEAD/DEAH box helicase [Chitinivibrionales bacterium]
MDVTGFLDTLRRTSFFENQIVEVRELSERVAKYATLAGGLHDAVRRVLETRGIQQLYEHQVAAIENVRDGRSTVVVTGTASGKTLCYTIPVIEAILESSQSTALFIYPTKALAQDQLRALQSFREQADDITFMAGTYDGDTPQNLRRKLRDGANVILTNPDMLHQAILPQHARWSRFFTNLQFVVIDEVHAYRGVFGSHLANVMRRLRRVCAHYGSAPRFICSSATVANPAEHARRICGTEMALVENDGAPRGPKRFVFWNPPALEAAAAGSDQEWRTGGGRRSALREAAALMTSLVKHQIQTIAFVRTRLAAELIHKDCRSRLSKHSRSLAESVCAYRGGYLPEERRRIEQSLAAREILGVASTNALELGIDIGSLDACILVGYPGTVASLWQQMGRAGRGSEEAAVFLLGQNSPVDQYLMLHPSYIFQRNPEQAVIDPDNPHIVVGHLKCAANELPLTEEDAAEFGQFAVPVLELLEEEGLVKSIDGRWYWSSSAYPAADVSLRNIAGPVYTIQDESAGQRVIGTLDELSALAQLHTHAVYLHGGDTYFVERLDVEQKIAFVRRQDLDYYTQSVQSSQIRLDEKESTQPWLGGELGFGDVTVTTTIPMFKKVRFHSRESLGFEKLELPPQELETVALYFAPSLEAVASLSERGMDIGAALTGIANVIGEVAPMFVMCDTQDIGTVVDSANLGRDAVFVHDRYPGGMGYARRCMDEFDRMMRTVAEVVRGCPCPDGCPSCVGSALPAGNLGNLDSSVRGRIPDKRAAAALLDAVLNQKQ